MNNNESRDITSKADIQGLKISPIKKTRPSLMLPRSAFKSTVITSEDSSPLRNFPQAARKNKSLSSPNLNQRSLIYEELGSLENQIKDINTQLVKNIRVIQEKQRKSIWLNETLHKIELKTMPTDISVSEGGVQWPLCHKSCMIS